MLVLLATLGRRLHDIGLSIWWLSVWPIALAAVALVHGDIRVASVVLQPWHLLCAVVVAPVAALSALPPTAAAGRFGHDPRAPMPRPRMDAEASAVEADRLLAKMSELALPTLLMRPTVRGVFSKLGGKPELPAGMDWPYGREHPRCFVAQLDLAEVRAGDGPDWLPAEGRLYFFYDEDSVDALELVTCHSTHDPPGAARSAPEAYEPDPMFNERRVTFERLTSMPSLDWLGALGGSQLADADFDELSEAPDKPFGDGPQHRIGGFASEIQSAQMEVEVEFRTRGAPQNYRQVPPDIAQGAKDWRLLLQVDSDDDLSMNWVDTGRLYVFIREQDARAGDFSKTATIIQFY